MSVLGSPQPGDFSLIDLGDCAGGSTRGSANVSRASRGMQTSKKPD